MGAPPAWMAYLLVRDRFDRKFGTCDMLLKVRDVGTRMLSGAEQLMVELYIHKYAVREVISKT